MSFSHKTVDGVEFLTSSILSSSVRHAFSTRIGGVSQSPWDSLNLGVGRGDNPADVQENYRRFCSSTGMNVNNCVLSKQEHEDHILIVTESDIGKGLWKERDYTSIDAMICNIPDIPLVVFSADCNILLFHDPVHHAIGAAHAGWRGTALAVARKTALEMERVFHCDLSQLEVAVGPAIGSCCFETDEDVPSAMLQSFGSDIRRFISENGRKYHVDLKSINAWQLQEIGVRNIDICPECTACHTELYWSHRKLGNQRGAQIAMISL